MDAMYKLFFKEFVDRLGALAVLVALIPLFMVVTALIFLEDGGPILYRQPRLGKARKMILVNKFRSMTHRSTRRPYEGGEIIGSHDEVTRIGAFIRRFKIDELPQLFNVLMGEMALVGPRPCMPESLKEFDERGLNRFHVLPGCTGLAQIHGNIFLTWEERGKFDAYYVKHLSLALDLWILWKTFSVILFGDNNMIQNFEEFQNSRKSKVIEHV